jgi:hypothetical protein
MLEGARDVARRAGVVVLQVATQDERDAEGGDEGVGPQDGDDESIEEPDHGGHAQREEHAREDHAVLPGHGLGGDERREPDQVGDREIERPGEDHHGLADGDQPERRGAGEDVEKAALVEEYAALESDEDTAGHEEHGESEIDGDRGGDAPEPGLDRLDG